jgi:hypothetical protein
MSSVDGFQELATGAQRKARLLDWGARVLYLGPAFGLTPHRNATGVLAVALDGAIGVADNPRARMPNYRQARSVLSCRTACITCVSRVLALRSSMSIRSAAILTRFSRGCRTLARAQPST